MRILISMALAALYAGAQDAARLAEDPTVKVALEAARQTQTVAELAKTFQVHPVEISQWKKQLLDGAESLFRDGRRREHEDGQALQAELFERIGRLNMEVEWLKKKRCPLRLTASGRSSSTISLT